MFQELWYEALEWATTDPVGLVLWGVAGGVVVAFLLIRVHRRWQAPGLRQPGPAGQISSDINISHIQVVGAGGLGLVATCAVVAIVIPLVGLSLGAGCVLGTLMAIGLIVKRSHAGPISSSSQKVGANTVLRIDDDEDSRPSA
jgi:hypothetical protein